MATETSCDPLQENDITESSVMFFLYPYYIVILNEDDFVILNGAEGEVKDLEHQILRDHREKYVFLTLLSRTD